MKTNISPWTAPLSAIVPQAQTERAGVTRELESRLEFQFQSGGFENLQVNQLYWPSQRHRLSPSPITETQQVERPSTPIQEPFSWSRATQAAVCAVATEIAIAAPLAIKAHQAALHATSVGGVPNVLSIVCLAVSVGIAGLFVARSVASSVYQDGLVGAIRDF